jgi:hypothetical protein
MKIIDFVKVHGGAHVPAAVAALGAISEVDLLKRVQDKFKLMRKDWKARVKLVEAADEAAAEAERAAAEKEKEKENEWSDEDVAGNPDTPATSQHHPALKKRIKLGASAPKLQSRAIGVRLCSLLCFLNELDIPLETSCSKA